MPSKGRRLKIMFSVQPEALEALDRLVELERVSGVMFASRSATVARLVAAEASRLERAAAAATPSKRPTAAVDLLRGERETVGPGY